MRQTNSRKQGFTIVELLIVVVVIAILAAITVVAYVGIQEQARHSAQVSELSQLQRRIQVEVLKSTGNAISIGTPIAFGTGGTGATTLSDPLVAAQDLTLYGVFDTTNNMASYSWSAIIALSPTDANNSIRLRTGAASSDTGRGFWATSSQPNRDLTQSGIMNTTARHIGWITATTGSIAASFDNNAPTSSSTTAHTGWNFDTVSHYSNAGFTPVASLVFKEYHDAATRAQMVQWLNGEYSVGL